MVRYIVAFLSILPSLAANVALAGIGDIVPRPQTVRMWPSSAAFRVTSQTAIVLGTKATSGDTVAARYLQTEIAAALGFTPAIRRATGSDTGVIHLGTRESGSSISSEMSSRGLTLTEEYPGPEGYALDVRSSGVMVAGSDASGTFYGAVTLAQLLANDGSRLEGMTVVDHPDLPNRMIYLRPNMQVSERTDSTVVRMERAASYKMNRAVIADYKFNVLDRVPAHYYTNVDRVKKAATDLAMTIVPAVTGPGYGEGLLAHNPNLAEGFLVEDAVFVSEGTSARHVPDPAATLADGGFENPAGNTFSGWSWQDLAGTRTFADFGTKRSGNSSVRLENFTAGESHTNARIVKNLTVKPHRNYLLTVYARSENLSSSANILALGFSEVVGPSSLAHEAFGFHGTNAWTKLEVSFNSLNHSEIGVYLGVWGGSSGTLWFDDAELTEIALVNVLRRDGTPLTVESTDGHVFEEGVDYQYVVDPLLGSVPYAGVYTKSHVPPTLRPTAGGAISAGDTLLVSYYHPMIIYNYQVVACVSDPEISRIYDEILGDVIELFEPEMLMLGHDEIRAMNQDHACRQHNTTPANLLGSHMQLLVGKLAEMDPDLEVGVWSDMFDPNHNARDDYYLIDGDLTGIIDMIPKSLWIMAWHSGVIQETLGDFSSRGFQTMGSNDATSSTAKTRDWAQALRDVDGAGKMFTTWDDTYDDVHVLADYMWSISPYVTVHPPTTAAGQATILADVGADEDELSGSVSIRSVTLGWREGSSGEWQEVAMTSAGGGRYSRVVASTSPSFYIRAEDSSGNVQLAPPRAPERSFPPIGALSGIPVAVEPEAARSDFDDDGVVNFNDFLVFAGAFGSSDERFDYDDDGRVDFDDFLTFVEDFGKRVR